MRHKNKRGIQFGASTGDHGALDDETPFIDDEAPLLAPRHGGEFYDIDYPEAARTAGTDAPIDGAFDAGEEADDAAGESYDAEEFVTPDEAAAVRNRTTRRYRAVHAAEYEPLELPEDDPLADSVCAPAPVKSAPYHRKARFSRKGIIGIIVFAVAVLVAAAVGIFQYTQYMQMIDMDSTAQKIYKVASKNIQAQQEQDKLSALSDAVVSQGQVITAQPIDYEAGNWADVSLYRVQSGSAVADELISGESTLRLPEGSSFIMEVSPSTGQVYSVFYSTGTLDYAAVSALTSRDQAQRMGVHAGYYRGIDSVSASPEKSFKGLTASLVNGNELYLKISGVRFDTMVKDISKMSIKLEISGAESAATGALDTSATMTLQGGTDFTIAEPGTEIDIIMDSLRTGYSFNDIFGASGIAPGSDITVSTTVLYETAAYAAANCEGLKPVTANSLYAKRNSNSGAVEVANVRHLRNLSASVTAPESYLADPLTFGKVDVVSDIDFDASTWNLIEPAAMQSVSWQSRSGGAAYNPLEKEPNAFNTLRESGRHFTPIENDAASAAKNPISFAGNNHVISNMVVQTEGQGGLFARTSMAIKDLQLVNPVVLGGDGTGTLVGVLTGAGSITNCRVFLTGDGENDVSGVFRVEGGADTGGLVGRSESTGAITRCIAAISVKGTGSVGGFIGSHIGTGAVSQCYASGTVVADNEAGGFAGYVAGTISDAMSTSGVRSSGVSGGFAGNFVSGTIKSSRAYGRVVSTDGTANTNAPYSGGFVGSAVEGVTATGNAFLQMHDYNEFTREGTAPLCADILSYEQAVTADPISVEATHSYAAAEIGRPFPFALPVGLDVYYGNWPEVVTVSFCSPSRQVLQTYQMLSGDHPTFTEELPSVNESYTSGSYSVEKFTGWTDTAGSLYPTGEQLPATSADAVFIATYGQASFDGIAQKLYSVENTALWQYLAQAGVSANGFTVADIAFGPDWGGGIGTYAIPAGMDSTGSYSWAMFVRGGSSAVPVSVGQSSADPNNYTGNAVSYVGTYTAGTATVEATQYDAGRGAKGQPAFRHGTIVATAGTCDPNTFTPSGNWF